MKKLLLAASLAAVSTLAFANTPLASTSNAQFYTFGSASTKLSFDYTTDKSVVEIAKDTAIDTLKTLRDKADKAIKDLEGDKTLTPEARKEAINKVKNGLNSKSHKVTDINFDGKVKLGLGGDFVFTEGFTGGFKTSFTAKKPFYGKTTTKIEYPNTTVTITDKKEGDALSGTYSLDDTYVYFNVNSLGQLTLGKTSTAVGDLLQGGQADAFGGVKMDGSADLVANYVSPELIPGLVLSYDFAFLTDNSSQYGVKVAYNYAPFTASLSAIQQSTGDDYTRGLEFAVTADDLGLDGLSAYADFQYAQTHGTYKSVKDKKVDDSMKDFAPLQVIALNGGASYTLNQYLTASLDLGFTHSVATKHSLKEIKDGVADVKTTTPTNAFSTKVTLDSTVYTYSTASLGLTAEGGFTYTKPKDVKGTTELFGSLEAKLSF